MTTTPDTEIQQIKEFIQDGFNQLKGDIEGLDKKVDEVKDDVTELPL